MITQAVIDAANELLAWIDSKFPKGSAQRLIMQITGIEAAVAGLEAISNGQLPTFVQASALAAIVLTFAVSGAEDLAALAAFDTLSLALTRAGIVVSDEVIARKIYSWFGNVYNQLTSIGLMGLRVLQNIWNLFAGVSVELATGLAPILLGLGGTTTMACSNTHGSRVQGPGLCCQAVASGALTKPAAGTTLPPYAPGQSLTLPAGRITMVTDSGGHCGQCMIVGSKSPKHPGKPVLKFVRGGPGCPAAGSGCCSMAA